MFLARSSEEKNILSDLVTRKDWDELIKMIKEEKITGKDLSQPYHSSNKDKSWMWRIASCADKFKLTSIISAVIEMKPALPNEIWIAAPKQGPFKGECIISILMTRLIDKDDQFIVKKMIENNLLTTEMLSIISKQLYDVKKNLILILFQSAMWVFNLINKKLITPQWAFEELKRDPHSFFSIFAWKHDNNEDNRFINHIFYTAEMLPVFERALEKGLTLGKNLLWTLLKKEITSEGQLRLSARSFITDLFKSGQARVLWDDLVNINASSPCAKENALLAFAFINDKELYKLAKSYGLKLPSRQSLLSCYADLETPFAVCSSYLLENEKENYYYDYIQISEEKLAPIFLEVEKITKSSKTPALDVEKQPEIFVKDRDNKTYSVHVSLDTSVHEFKIILLAKLNLHPSVYYRMLIIFAGKQLIDGTLRSYNIERESTLFMQTSLRLSSRYAHVENPPGCPSLVTPQKRGM